jgi:hypothetical protein
MWCQQLKQRLSPLITLYGYASGYTQGNTHDDAHNYVYGYALMLHPQTTFVSPGYRGDR